MALCEACFFVQRTKTLAFLFELEHWGWEVGDGNIPSDGCRVRIESLGINVLDRHGRASGTWIDISVLYRLSYGSSANSVPESSP